MFPWSPPNSLNSCTLKCTDITPLQQEDCPHTCTFWRCLVTSLHIIYAVLAWTIWYWYYGIMVLEYQNTHFQIQYNVNEASKYNYCNSWCIGRTLSITIMWDDNNQQHTTWQIQEWTVELHIFPCKLHFWIGGKQIQGQMPKSQGRGRGRGFMKVLVCNQFVFKIPAIRRQFLTEKLMWHLRL